MIFEQLSAEELLGEESLCFGCGRDIPDRRRLVRVASSPPYGGNLMVLDGGTSDSRREPDDGRDVGMGDMDHASNTDRSDGLPPKHDGSMDPCRGDPSSMAAEVHRNRSVDNRMDASEACQGWPKEAQLRHCHPVSYHQPRGRVADDCHWHLPLLECSC